MVLGTKWPVSATSPDLSRLVLSLCVDASDGQAVDCPLAGEGVGSKSLENGLEKRSCLVERIDYHSARPEKPRTMERLQCFPSFRTSPSFPF